MNYLHTIDAPCLIPGDFNLVLSREEKKGGKWNSSFQSAVFELWNDLGAFDLGFHDYSLTWFNLQEGTNLIQERLDRFCACPRWIQPL